MLTCAWTSLLFHQEKNNLEIDLNYKLKTLQQRLEQEQTEHRVTRAQLTDKYESIEEAKSAAMNGMPVQCQNMPEFNFFFFFYFFCFCIFFFITIACFHLTLRYFYLFFFHRLSTSLTFCLVFFYYSLYQIPLHWYLSESNCRKTSQHVRTFPHCILMLGFFKAFCNALIHCSSIVVCTFIIFRAVVACFFSFG